MECVKLFTNVRKVMGEVFLASQSCFPAWKNTHNLFVLFCFHVFIYLFIFGCVESSLLRVGFL